MREIRSASRQQMDAILTSEQKAQIEAIRQDTKTKMDAVLTDSTKATTTGVAPAETTRPSATAVLVRAFALRLFELV
jgi:hypothetical protein